MSVDIQALKSLGLTEQPAAQATKKNEMGQDMFMKLMMAQLQNQNPLKPQDSSEFLSQLAQFNMVSGIQDLKKDFATFASNMNEEQALQAANLVGRKVLIPSSKGILGADGGLSGEIGLPSEASSVTVRVVAPSGATLRTLELGPQAAGLTSFHWDGLLDDGVHSANPGTYTIKAEAMIDGKTVALDPQIRTPVESVSLGGAKGIEVDLGVLGRHGLKDIQEIL